MNTRWKTSAAAAGVLMALASGVVLAQAFPAKAVRIVVGYPPGGGNDLIARAVGNRLAELWKQPVVVENRAGASGSIGAEHVARSAPDGHTLLLTGTSHLIHGASSRKVPYRAVDDFSAISVVGTAPMVIEVHPSVPATNVRELIALAKTRRLAYGSSGTGTSPHIAGEMFTRMAGVTMTHVPYRGSAPAQTDLIGGQIQVAFQVTQSALPSIKANQVRGIAVTGRTRLADLPDLPTVSESGLPGYTMELWWGLLGPVGIPPSTLKALNDGVRAAVASPEVQKALGAAGLAVGASSPEEMHKLMRSDFDAFARLVKDAGIASDD
ncbi:MAG: tripartite tricarboxylate transporter substrate binding protein [Burkholderiales bacterium]|nr:tripartite tricarboxylate transporter substrate binding protein [Burkholderiales bacterium]